MSDSKSRSVRWIVLVLAIVAVGFAGVYFGRALRSRTQPPVTAETPPFAFEPGDLFPRVALTDSLERPVASDSLLANGGVVLLLDPDCDGCTDMSIRWEHALATGFIDRTLVFGVSRFATSANSAYRATHRLSFPIYRDSEDAFLSVHGVTSYPLEVVVGRSGTIQSLSDDSVTPVDEEAIRMQLSE
jgi:peroxiredoxin